MEGLEGTIYLTLLMEGLDPDVVEGRQLEEDWKRRQLEGLDPMLLLEGDWKLRQLEGDWKEMVGTGRYCSKGHQLEGLGGTLDQGAVDGRVGNTLIGRVDSGRC